MKFEVTVEDDLLTKAFNYCIPVQSVFTEALHTAVDAAEAAQELGEGVEPVESEGGAEKPLNEPYATVRDWYTGTSYYSLMNDIRRINRKAFGRRARFTIYPDGQMLTKKDGTVAGAFVVEVRRAKRTS